MERYRAVWRPIEYYNRVREMNPWKRVFFYIGPVILISVIYNLPKFFEPEFREFIIPTTVLNKTTNTYIKVSCM